VLQLAAALPARAAPGEASRPPRHPASPQHFGRVQRPVQPRTTVAAFAGYFRGREVSHHQESQGAFGLLAELAIWRLGLFIELPLALQIASTEGVYGRGSGSTLGAGDLRFGLDGALVRFSRWGLAWQLGAGAQVSAPTRHAARVYPRTPELSAPWHAFAEERWTISTGAGLSAASDLGLSGQLNVDLLLQVRDAPDLHWYRNPSLLVCTALTVGYRPLPWLEPLLQLDLLLEAYGLQVDLRQMLFLAPALRLWPLSRLAVDLTARISVTDEARNESAWSLGVAITVGLGPRADGAW
jgi:hypothetical protein